MQAMQEPSQDIVNGIDGMEALIIYVEPSFMTLCKFVHLHRHVPIVLLFYQPITEFGSDYCSVLRMDDYLKSLLLVIWATI